MLVVVAYGGRRQRVRFPRTVSWEAGPAEWGVLLSLGESMWDSEFDLKHDHQPEALLQRGAGWYSEPHFRFDVGFIEN
jgi:hypothetical protein